MINIKFIIIIFIFIKSLNKRQKKMAYMHYTNVAKQKEIDEKNTKLKEAIAELKEELQEKIISITKVTKYRKILQNENARN